MPDDDPPPIQVDEQNPAQRNGRRHDDEEEMERLLLAQENNDIVRDEQQQEQQQGQDDFDDDQPIPPEALIAPDDHDDIVDGRGNQQRYSKRPRLPYTTTSFVAALLLMYYALRTRQQWYLALAYLTTSKWAYIVLGNALIALCVSTFRFFTKTFLRGLRLAEAEGLSDFFRWNVTETCLALAMFRSELDVNTFLIFLLLILAKCLHWVAETREGHLRMTQEAVVPLERNGGGGGGGWLQGFPIIPSTHLRLIILLNWLIILDIAAVVQCGYDIAHNGPSVAILFGFETTILLVSAMSSTILWNLHVIDGFLHYLHDYTTSAATPWITSFLHTWKDHKATLIFAVEVQAQGAKFLFYVTFFAIVLTYYGLPINLFREVYLSFQKLRSRLVAFANYRRLMASMERFDSLSTEDELDEAGRVCIICRDEMTLRGCKRLPGCGHVFHSSCLREWLVQQQTCPTCRGDIAAMQARQRQQRRMAEQQQQQAQRDREREQQQQQQQQQATAEAASVNESAAEAATLTAVSRSAAPDKEQQQEERGAPELQVEPAHDGITSVLVPPSQAKRTVRIQLPTQTPVFPCLYRVTAHGGAIVWSDDGIVQRTVPCGVAILCTQLKWLGFTNGRSGMMLRMPDGWVREDAVERIHSFRLPAKPASPPATPSATSTS